MSGAELMEKRIREYMEVKSGFGDPIQQERMLQKEFKLFDRDNSGSIDMAEFKKVLTQLNCLGSDADVDELFDRYDADCSGSITYSEFTDQMFYHNKADKAPSEPNATKSIVARVKEEIIKRGSGNGLRSAAVMLRRMDADGSGNLDVGEFKAGLEMLGIEDVLDVDMERLMKAFDKDESGKISVEEFYRGLQGNMKRKRKLIVKQAFDVLDSDGSGEVTVADIRGAYDCSQHPSVLDGTMSVDEALSEILEVYEQGVADGIVTFQEFLEYYRDISAGISDDGYFELMVRNAWHLSGGEGAAANSANRRVCVTHMDGSEKIYEIENDLGIGPKDIEKMMAQLVKQGVKDIKKISP
jgi:Ca2+-binding EF-hand superfamily protein